VSTMARAGISVGRIGLVFAVMALAGLWISNFYSWIRPPKLSRTIPGKASTSNTEPKETSTYRQIPRDDVIAARTECINCWIVMTYFGGLGFR